MTTAYSRIDRFLRQNLNDKDYPAYKDELDAICQAKLQRTWVELTDEEIARACGWSAHGWWTHPMPYEIKIAKAIEAKLKEKNNA